jgi:hypothetical protein
MLEKRIPRKTYRQLKHHAIVKKVLYTPSLVLSYVARVIPSGREQTGQYHLGLLWCLVTAGERPCESSLLKTLPLSGPVSSKAYGRTG